MQMPASKPRRASGFTLLELMIVVVIVGILAAIALPSYSVYIMRSKIIDGTTNLGDMRVQMEKFFLDNRTYLSGGACAVSAAMTTFNSLPGHYFTLSCPAAAADSYTLQADGVGPMTGFQFQVTQTNAKTTVAVPGGWGGTGATCWVTRKDGSC
jgi:type IV pilus assembly protein PilE